MSFEFDQELDCSGLSCPMPILKTKKALNTMETGQVLKMISTDAGSVPDVNAFSAKTGNELLGHEEDDGTFTFFIKKK
ncbi:MAG: sulfurtransferase TusA family protein [Anaerolineales bacterium]|jgi:tRNA 2-thiouridine synthesizing protein A